MNSDFEEYLDIKVYQDNFVLEDTKLVRSIKELKTHPCSDAELGLDGSKTTKFY